MRRIIVFFVLIVAVATGAYGLTYYYGNSRQPENQWTWLRREFELNDAQFARIHALQAAYQPVCAGHCRRIMAAQEHLADLARAGRKNTPEYFATLSEWEAIKRECNAATFKHIEAVAAVMAPTEGRRYLDMMVPRIVSRDHLGPMGVR